LTRPFVAPDVGRSVPIRRAAGLIPLCGERSPGPRPPALRGSDRWPHIKVRAGVDVQCDASPDERYVREHRTRTSVLYRANIDRAPSTCTPDQVVRSDDDEV